MLLTIIENTANFISGNPSIMALISKFVIVLIGSLCILCRACSKIQKFRNIRNLDVHLNK